MVIGFTLLTLLGIGLIVSLVDDDDDSSSNSVTEPDGVEVTGTEDSEIINGTEGTDLLIGGDGQDIINGDASSDTIEGGAGDDRIVGDAGDDQLLGQADDDVIIGGGGDDTIASGQGDDFAQGRGGDDRLTGSLGRDWLEGGDGSDTIAAGFGEDTLVGGTGADSLEGGGGTDLIMGGDLAEIDLSEFELAGLRDGTLNFVEAAGLEDLDDVLLSVADVEDNAADTLNGGDGNDALLIGSGDIATGGEGEDEFGIFADALSGDQGPSTITDYVPGEDFIFILDDPDAATPASVSVLTAGDDAIVALNGQPVTIVNGAAGSLSTDDIGFIAGIPVAVLDPNTTV
ncbi:calcium-binding protein [uncultured Tateyamaria sp.]|uniref:calcium-binding protein n=1 Tax=uncultured Tateyamaria sp. TaxID=455651 RepID=UPI00262CBD8A|nr:calcium-binding protein [uncultured Tateyamaria sp.]